MKNLKKSNINLILEYSEFNQYQLGIDSVNPLGPAYGFAIDPGLSIYGTDQDSPYVDYYSRNAGSMNRLSSITKSSSRMTDTQIKLKSDDFIEDIDKYSGFKILRIFRNESLYIDVYISFMFEDEEFFGVFNNYNQPYVKNMLKSEMFKRPDFDYINHEYILKVSNYIRNKLDNWFRPEEGIYKCLKDDCHVRNKMGQNVKLKQNSTYNIIGSSINKDSKPYVIIIINDEEYRLVNNDYYYFNYWFEKIK